MRAVWIAGGLLLAACLAACSGDPPVPAQPQQAESAVQERKAEPVQELSARTATTQPQLETRTTVIQTSVKEQQAEAQPVEEAEPDGQSAQEEADAGKEVDAANVRASALAEALTELTDVPAVVVGDAEMRVRPGLPWGVNRRLTAGDEVEVLSRTYGWLRVRVDDCEGWVRSPALDLGEDDDRNIREEPAPPIIAEWEGVEYGVMGQSADAADVRLLGDSEEFVSAPKSEVTLLVSDITLDDLPVLIGDETVVFLGDDFRAGQGKILPRADEWMWLPWGWLLAHNEEYIWQWRPETDELEFIRRPPGPARFSPNGQLLAIATCRFFLQECLQDSDTIIVPLDGGEPVSSREAIRRRFPGLDFLIGFGYREDLTWTSDSSSMLAPVSVRGRASDAGTVMRTPASSVQPMALLTTDSEVTLFVEVPAEHVGRGDCYYGQYAWQSWRLREDDTIGILVYCRDGQDDADFEVVYGRNGEFLRLEPWGNSQATDDRSQEIRGADDRRALRETLQVVWSPSTRHAIVISEESNEMWLYGSLHRELTLLVREGENADVAVDWGRLKWEVHWVGDQFAAVVPRSTVRFARAVIVVGIAESMASIMDIGRVNGLPCSFATTWSPNMNLMTVGFQSNDTPQAAAAGFWIDGTSIRNYSVGQQLISATSGGEASILRTPSHGSFLSSFHRAEWSPGGEWLAIGGNHEWSSCHLGH